MAASGSRSRIYWILAAIVVLAAAMAIWPWLSEKWRDAQKMRIDPQALRTKDLMRVDEGSDLVAHHDAGLGARWRERWEERLQAMERLQEESRRLRERAHMPEIERRPEATFGWDIARK